MCLLITASLRPSDFCYTNVAEASVCAPYGYLLGQMIDDDDDDDNDDDDDDDYDDDPCIVLQYRGDRG